MSTLFHWLTAPFAHEFMQRGLMVAVLVGAVCAVLSCFLVLKGWSLMGDAVSHAVLPGIVLAHVVGAPLTLGAFVAGLGCALSTGYLRQNSRVKEDAVLAIVFSGMFALGLVLFVKIDTDQHLNHILFGNMLGVTWGDIVEVALIAVPTLGVVLAKRRDLMLYCFDPAQARAIGLPVRMLEFALLVFLALTIVASLKAVGVILVIAMLIAPGAIGFLLARQFDRMIMIAMIAAVTASVLGTIVSFHIDSSTGPTIVVLQAALFSLALGIRVWRDRARRREQLNPV
jgi:manganese/iron transport system permease protein